MPTAPLPLFRDLLRALDIPLSPPTIPSIPPSLLLLTLERILGTRVPLSAALRKCSTQAEELALVKCLMGIMADDELGMDLTAVGPARVVKGCTDEMGVMIMALVVIAKRRGVAIFQPAHEGDRSFGSIRGGSEMSIMGGDDADRSGLYGSDVMDTSGRWYGLDLIDAIDDEISDEAGGQLERPLEPDITLSSPVVPTASTSTFASRDVFGEVSIDGDRLSKAKSGLFGKGKVVDGDVGLGLHPRTTDGAEGDWTVDRYDPDGGYETPMPRNGFNVPLVPSGPKSGDPDIGGGVNTREGVAKGYLQAHLQNAVRTRDLRNALAFEKVADWREHSETTATTATTATTSTLVTGSSGHRTVLQEMMDEFGLG